jgi:hypothetical protein
MQPDKTVPKYRNSRAGFQPAQRGYIGLMTKWVAALGLWALLPHYASAQQFADELIAQAPLVTYRVSTELDKIVPPKVTERVEPEDTDEARLAALESRRCVRSARMARCAM